MGGDIACLLIGAKIPRRNGCGNSLFAPRGRDRQNGQLIT
jgi:hypothetical protein